MLLLLGAVRRKRVPFPRAPLADWPHITIVLPAHNEAAVIGATLENLLHLDYPAERRQIREGKTAAENASLRLLRGDVIVNTDASVLVERGALKRLIAAFADPTVGVASSHNVSVAPVRIQANYAESWYVGYDMWVRTLESRVYGIVGATRCVAG